MKGIEMRTLSQSGAALRLRCACYTATLSLGLGMASLAEGDSGDAPIAFHSTELVVGLFLGQQPTAGYRAQVVRLEVGDSEVRVICQVHNPPPDAVVAQVLTQPFHLIRMPRLGLPIRFERR